MEDQAQPWSVEDKFKSVKADEFQTINGKAVKPETVTVTGLSLAGQVSGIRINYTADTSISGKPATTITVENCRRATRPADFAGAERLRQ